MYSYQMIIKAKLVTSIKLILISSLGIALWGCQTNAPEKRTPVVIDDLSLHEIKKQNQEIKLAIAKLENGKTRDAQVIIDRVLRINPNHNTAKILRKQLTKAPEEIFKTSRFTNYKVKQGETLGSIAQDWLENSIYFVSLAKHNRIKNPAKIQPGLVLNIPVIKNSPLVKKERRRSRANINLLKDYTSKEQYKKSLARMTEIFIVNSHQQELIELQKETLNLLAVSHVSISNRHKMIEQVKTISDNNKRRYLTPQFNQFIQLQLQSVLLDEFALLFDDNSFLQAADKLISAKKIRAISKQNKNVLNMEKELVDRLHENAIVLKKNQQLEKAAESWGKILKIQPNNELALKYYHRTNKLLERLNKLN